MTSKAKRAAIYLRVSTTGQTVENQRRELEQVAARRGWTIAEVYEDTGISGAKGRDKRPGFDQMLKDASRRKFDVVMAWAIDRLGRSLIDLLATIQHLEATGVDLYLDQQNLDTTTPTGKLLFQITGAFAEFERTMIRQRVNAGLARARAQGKRLGRPAIDAKTERGIRDALSAGQMGMLKIAAAFGVGSGTVQRIKREMAAPAVAGT
jgi:DNA invertase Pin-like site-specific DNA recombinase